MVRRHRKGGAGVSADVIAAEGWRLFRNGQLQQAEQTFRHAIAQQPGHPSAINGLGRVALAVGRHDIAIACLAPYCEVVPTDDEAQMALVQALTMALRDAPGDVALNEQLGGVLMQAGDIERARDAYVATLVADPARHKPRWLVNRMLPRVYGSADEIARWRTRFVNGVGALATSIDPASADALAGVQLRSNFELPYQGQDDKAVQAQWGGLTARVMAAHFPDLAMRPKARPLEGRGDRRLKVGYASACFQNHTITLLFNGWIRQADRERFKVHLYLTGNARDGSTEALKRAAEVTRDADAGLAEAARLIRADELDILVYPDLGMDNRGMALAALPLAPIQCVSWGHPVTSGLPTMDYFLTSDLMEPEGGEAHYTERLVRLPRLSIAYTAAPAVAAADRATLGLPDGLLYLCCQALQKYLPQYDAVFPAIARLVPAARFVFIRHRSMHSLNRQFQARLEGAFRAAGLDAARHLVFLPWQPWSSFLQINATVDVFLDSIGWSGGNTTLEALSQGLPPVTLPTGFMRGRHTYAMLRQMGMDELIATDPADYVRIAARLGGDGAYRQEMRRRIAAARGRLYDDVGTVRALEAFYQRAHAEALKED